MKLYDGDGDEVPLASIARLIGPIDRKQLLLLSREINLGDGGTDELMRLFVEQYGLDAPLVMVVPDVSQVELLSFGDT